MKKKDTQANYTYTGKTSSKLLTIDSMEKIFKEARIIPYEFIPTGEIVYVTPEVHLSMEKHKKNKNP